jgi:hypothetical protein
MKFKELREKYRSKYPAALVAAAVKIAIDMGGAMTPAVKKIEAMKRGLSDDPIVKDALRQANESVKESVDLDESTKAYAASLEKMANDRKLKNISKKDRDTLSKLADMMKNANENYAQELDLAQKNIARLSKKESGQDQKDYQAVARALNQGNLGAVKKVIKGISTKEIQADILNVLVGYNDLIAKMYPKAMSGGKFKSGMTVDKMIKDDVNEAKAPKAKGLNIYGSEISGLKNKKGRPHTVKPMNDKGKLKFRVTDEFGSFKTVDLKTFAKEFG